MFIVFYALFELSTLPPQMFVSMPQEYLCDGETKFPIEQPDHFNPSLGHKSITNFIPVKQMIHYL